MSEVLLVEDRARVRTLTLNRPDALNAFNNELYDATAAALRDAGTDDSVAVVVLTGAGRAFCAGMDLSVPGNVFGLDESLEPTLADLDDLDDPKVRAVRDTGGRVTLAVYRCRKPVIAAINGAAVGIGATMTLAMDARLLSTNARFGLVFGRIGITPEAVSTWFLPRLVGLSTALDLVYRADILSAAQAEAVGLATATHEPDALLAEARLLADAWTLGRSPVATALARQMLYRNANLPGPTDAHRVDSLSMFYASLGDGKEGVAAFLERRDPRFTGRASVMPPFYDEWLERG